MLLADLGPADGKALKPALIHQGGGIVAYRPLKGGAGAAVFQGLLFPAAGHVVLHGRADGGFLAGGEGQHRFHDDTARTLLKDAVAVGKFQRRGRQGAVFPGFIQEGDLREDIPELAAVGTGIHVYSPAQRTGDAKAPFQAGKAVFCSGPAGSDERGPGPAAQGIALPGDGGKVAIQLDDRAGNAAIADQQIAAPAQNKGVSPRRPAEGNGGLQLGTGAGVQQQRRPADAKGGTAAHGFIFGIGDARILQLFQ